MPRQIRRTAKTAGWTIWAAIWTARSFEEVPSVIHPAVLSAADCALKGPAAKKNRFAEVQFHRGKSRFAEAQFRRGKNRSAEAQFRRGKSRLAEARLPGRRIPCVEARLSRRMDFQHAEARICGMKRRLIRRIMSIMRKQLLQETRSWMTLSRWQLRTTGS